MTRILPISIPSTELNEVVSDRDSTIKQLQKDVERDVLILNGIKLLGNIGLQEIVEDFCATIDEALASCSLNRFCLSEELKREFALTCLRKASRTNSGGQSFQALQSLVNLSDITIIPHSSLASPLRIRISCGNIKSTGSKVGLVGLVQTTTIFELLKVTEFDDETSTSPLSNSAEVNR